MGVPPALLLPPSPDDLGRDKLRRFKYVGFLGKGGFAEVAKYVDTGATAEGGGREVAIKSVNKAAYRAGVNLGAVKELQAMAELEHPNIVRVSCVHGHAALRCTSRLARSWRRWPRSRSGPTSASGCIRSGAPLTAASRSTPT